MPFESVISGPRPDLIVDALHGNRHVLIKLHGDWQDRVGRTFAKSEYESHYGATQTAKKRVLLGSAQQLLVSSRSILFIGASLEADRTMSLRYEVHEKYTGIRHFAIVQTRSMAEFQKRERDLNAHGIVPYWYEIDGHKTTHSTEVLAAIEKTIDRISVKEIKVPSASLKERRLAARLKASKRNWPSAAADAFALHDCPQGELLAHVDRVAHRIEDGQITFFLGSAIHARPRLMAKEFNQELSRRFECPPLLRERFAVSQYIADRYGRKSLDDEITGLVVRTPRTRSPTHDFLAA